jgi:hypothetical protein
MNVPEESNKIWEDLLLKDTQPDFEFLALKLLLNRLRLSLKTNPDKQSIQDSARELRDMFVNHGAMPKVQADLQKILSVPVLPATAPAPLKKNVEQMNRALFDVDRVKQMILEGRKLILAADESVLARLPEGHWIGGTIPYFITDEGGVMSRDRIHVTELPPYIRQIAVRTYAPETVSAVYAGIQKNGLSIIIIPASSSAHLNFALKAPLHKGFASGPLLGWIAGVHVDEIGSKKAKVFFGEKLKVIEDGAVAMHMVLPQGYYADLNIINIFKQGSGDAISFLEDGFSVRDAMINGKKMNFAEYVARTKLDTKLPLVADYSGAMINVSFQNVEEAAGRVNLYAPVFRGVTYKHAAPIGNYVKEFTSSIPGTGTGDIFFSCNCILNYLYSELEGKRTGNITGPITFGEIAYQLLNQTMAYATIEKH